MKEIVVISGKGGTGKTSITASFAVLAENPVIADCDVDAADLYLVMSPDVKERHEFYAGHKAVIRPEDCIGCGACLAYCRFGAVHRWDGQNEGISSDRVKSDCEKCDYCERSCSVRTNVIIQEMKEAMGEMQLEAFTVDPFSCEGCGVCVQLCPVKAIDFKESLCGEWMISETRCGPMVHAKLGIAAENSGKLVSTVRREAKRIAEEANHSFIVVDGPPGIGCPVIASVTGSDFIIAVAEPTLSGIHDLERTLALTGHFGIKTAVIVNKWDINENITRQIEEFSSKKGALPIGRISYDKAVTQAMINKTTVLEFAPSKAAEEIKAIWNKITEILTS